MSCVVCNGKGSNCKARCGFWPAMCSRCGHEFAPFDNSTCSCSQESYTFLKNRIATLTAELEAAKDTIELQATLLRASNEHECVAREKLDRREPVCDVCGHPGADPETLTCSEHVKLESTPGGVRQPVVTTTGDFAIALKQAMKDRFGQ